MEQYEQKVKAGALRQINNCLEELPDYCEDYRNRLEKDGRSPRTIACYLQDLRLFYSYLKEKCGIDTFNRKYAGAVFLEALKPEMAENYIQNLKDAGAGESGLRRKVYSLRAFSEWLTESGYIEKSLCENISLPGRGAQTRSKPEKEPDPERILSLADEMVATKINALSAAEDENCATTRDALRPHFARRDAAIIALISGSILKLSEIASLNAGDILIEENAVRVWRRNEYEVLSVSAGVMQHISEYLLLSRSWIGARQEDEDALFLSSYHSRITTQSIQAMFRTFAIASYGKDCRVTPATFRRLCAQRMYDEHSASDVAKVLGYRSENAVKSIYRKSN